MKLFSTLLILAAVIGVSLAQDWQSEGDRLEDDSGKIAMCGYRLSDALIMLCQPFGGIARKKRSGPSDNPLAALMWHRNTRELMCSKPTQSAPCFCCPKFYGPCTVNTLIANFCAQPPPKFDKYFIKS